MSETMTKEKNPHGLAVGQVLILAYHGKVHGQAVVKKIGRTYATVKHGTWGSTSRIALDDLQVHLDDRLYGQVFLSEEHMQQVHEAEQNFQHLTKCWNEFCRNVHHWRVPEGLTMDKLQEAASALAIKLPAKEPAQ